MMSEVEVVLPLTRSGGSPHSSSSVQAWRGRKSSCPAVLRSPVPALRSPWPPGGPRRPPRSMVREWTRLPGPPPGPPPPRPSQPSPAGRWKVKKRLLDLASRELAGPLQGGRLAQGPGEEGEEKSGEKNCRRDQNSNTH